MFGARFCGALKIAIAGGGGGEGERRYLEIVGDRFQRRARTNRCARTCCGTRVIVRVIRLSERTEREIEKEGERQKFQREETSDTRLRDRNVH